MQQLTFFLAATVRMAAPLLIAALGLIVSERAGLMNIGVEGTMLSGAFAAFAISYYTQSYVLGLLAGMLAGGIMALLFAVAAIRFRAPQIVIGCAINLLGSGLTAVLFRKIFVEVVGGVAQVPSFPDATLPLLSKIPFIGEILFSHNVLIYFAFLMVPVMWFVMNRTPIGIQIIAVGEQPKVADSLGMTGGKGFIALAVVVLGKWKCFGALGGALLFGGANALQMLLQNLNLSVPNNLILMVPYIVTIIAVIASSGERAVDAASKGIPYEKA